jgi:WD40 repeat protein
MRQEIRRFQASDCSIQAMTWTREGSTRLLCVSSLDANIHVIDAATGLPIRIINGHSKTAFSLCVSLYLFEYNIAHYPCACAFVILSF